MKKRYIIAFVISSLVGTGMHFLYDIVPSPLTAVFAPVNESVWEHLKLIFWPFLTAALVLNRKEKASNRAWGAALSALLLMPLFLLGIYYMLAAGFAFTADWFNIVLYFITMAFGFWVYYSLQKNGSASKWTGILAILTAIYGAALIFFTSSPRNLPIFTEFSMVFKFF